MDMDKNKIDCIHVAVIGGAHHNTLGVIRSLGEQGIKKENIHVLGSISKEKFNAYIEELESAGYIKKWSRMQAYRDIF